MLSERQLNDLLKIFEERMQALNDEYITMMGEHLKSIGELKPTDVHRLTEMKRIGINAKAIQKKLAKAANKSIKDLDGVFRAVAQSDERFMQQWFEESYTPDVKGAPKLSKPIERILKAQLRITAQEFRNLSRTTVVTKPYRDAVDVAIQSVQGGVQDYQSAIRRALKETGMNGLRVQYESGLTRRADTAARQNVLDGVRYVNNDILRQLGNEYGADGVEISAHALCAEDHLPYQGKQFSNKDFGRIQNSLDRPFGQWNCKHTIYPIILGVSQPANDAATLERYRANSSEPIEINGKSKTRYEWSQEMRKLETAVRYQKDIANMAKASGDDVARREAQANMNALKERWRDIANAAGLEADATRMAVSGFRAVKVPKPAQSSLPNGGKSGIIQTDPNIMRFTRTHGALDQQYQDALMQRYANGDALTQKIYDKFIPSGGAVNDGNDSSGGAFYISGRCFDRDTQRWLNEGVYMNFTQDAANPRGNGTTWFHEHGHCVDSRAGNISHSDDFYNAIKKDCNDYENAVKQQHRFRKIDDVRFSLGLELRQLGGKSSGIQDIYGGSIGKQYPMVQYYHKPSYWRSGGKDALCAEAFAHMFDAKFDPEKQAMMQKYLPTAWKEFEKILGGIKL